MPDTYLMSENPDGGSTSVPDVMPTLFAFAIMLCVSGSYATPGQLVACFAVRKERRFMLVSGLGRILPLLKAAVWFCCIRLLKREFVAEDFVEGTFAAEIFGRWCFDWWIDEADVFVGSHLRPRARF